MTNESPDDDVTATDKTVPAAANSGAIATMGLELQEGRVIPRKQVFSWALWDWANQPFNTVILTFIFTALYLTTDVFIDPSIAALGKDAPAYEHAIAELTSGLGLANTIAGILVAAVAPVLGQRADGTGKRKRSLAISTGLVVLSMAALFFVQGAPAYFALGVGLVAVGSVFSEIAGVHYNAMLVQVSTPKTVGKVSGLGWGFGYLGGILALVLVVIAYVADWFGLPQDDGLPFRMVALGCAVWTVLFSIPIFRNVPELPATERGEKVNFFQSYVLLARHIARLWKTTRTTFWFLLASAVFRDGLAGVFAYGAVIASTVFGFGFLQVVIFGIAANLVAGVSTIFSGRLDDRFGPKAVIVTSLVGLVITGLAVFFLRDLGDVTFWIGGLTLCLFVGPAQAASRSFLARVTPAGREGEIFGLYATTGRAASFLSPALWTILIIAFGATAWGILGIVAVLFAGLIMMLFVRPSGANSSNGTGEPVDSVAGESHPASRETPSKPSGSKFAAATLLALGATSTVAQLIARQLFAPDLALAPGETAWSTGGLVALAAAIYMWATCKSWADFKRRIGVLIGATAALSFVAVYVIALLL